jgi:hypothetical protein
MTTLRAGGSARGGDQKPFVSRNFAVWNLSATERVAAAEGPFDDAFLRSHRRSCKLQKFAGR